MFIWLLAGMLSALLEIASAATVDQTERLQQWLRAVSQHEPGIRDTSVDMVSSWSTSELESLFPYVKALAELVGTGEFKPGWGLYSSVEVELLKGLAAQNRRGDINNIMKHGALLHSDIAMMARADNVPGPPPGPPARFSRLGPRFFVPRRPTVIADDARYEAFGREAIHWDYARMLLDSVRPSPSLDGMVRGWYQAIAAHFAGRYLLAQSLTHELFLADAEQALGGLDAAREAYEKAAALYPRAQSPYLGLSHLARRRGDRPAALLAIQRVLSLPADEREREDPWWHYHEGAGRHTDALLADVRASFRGGRQ